MWPSLSLYDLPRMMEYLKRVSLKRTPESFTFAFAGRTPSRVQELRDREFAGTIYEAWIHNDSHAEIMILHDSHRFFFGGRHASPATSGHACHANVLWRSLFHYRPCEECEVHYQCGWSLHADPGRAYEPWFDKWMRLVCLIMSNKDELMKRSWEFQHILTVLWIASLRIDCCITRGVHYCDISGEIPWSRRVTPLHRD